MRVFVVSLFLLVSLALDGMVMSAKLNYANVSRMCFSIALMKFVEKPDAKMNLEPKKDIDFCNNTTKCKNEHGIQRESFDHFIPKPEKKVCWRFVSVLGQVIGLAGWELD